MHKRMQAGVLVLGLVGIAQAIPLPVSILLAGGVISFQTRALFVASDPQSLRITRHITLLLLSWTAIAIMMGLYQSFSLMEKEKTISLFDGFAFGLRFGFALIPLGFLFFCVPLLLWKRNTKHQK